MKIVINSSELSNAINVVARAVSPRSTLPVLANILMATDNGRLKLSATNLEMGITKWITAKIDEEGSTTIPARTFSDLVGTLPNDQVKLSLNVRTQKMNIRCGSSNTDIKCIDAQEFPPLPTVNLQDGIMLDVSNFKEMIQQVVFAASTDEARPILTGVLVSVLENRITLQAADGFRLSVRKAELPEKIEKPIKAVIPARALNELARIANGEQLIMVLPKGRGQVIFHMQDIELVSQLIEGTFPDLDQVVPKSYNTRTIVSTSAFLKACKQAEIFAREGSNIARINVTLGDDTNPSKVEISGQSEETGNNQTDVEATIEGTPVLIAFNVRFLREVLDIIKTPTVALETTADTSPSVLKPVDGSDLSAVIMPMHLGN